MRRVGDLYLACYSACVYCWKKATLAHFLATLSMKAEIYFETCGHSLSLPPLSLSLLSLPTSFTISSFVSFPSRDFYFLFNLYSSAPHFLGVFYTFFYLSKFCFEFLTIIIQSEKFLISIFHFIMILLIMMKWCCSVCFSNFFVIFYKLIFPP